MSSQKKKRKKKILLYKEKEKDKDKDKDRERTGCCSFPLLRGKERERSLHISGLSGLIRSSGLIRQLWKLIKRSLLSQGTCKRYFMIHKRFRKFYDIAQEGSRYVVVCTGPRPSLHLGLDGFSYSSLVPSCSRVQVTPLLEDNL